MRVPPHWASSEEAVMEYPPDTLPAVPPGEVTCGIDWASDDHAVCVADMAGKVVVRYRVAVCNQLRAHLKIAFPGAVGLFAALDSPVSLAFLARFDCQDRADWLSPRRLAAWLEGQGYCGRKDPAELHARLAG